jgi:hypothetical protein
MGHEHEQTEIDAMIGLYPDALRAATYEAIKPYYDFTLDKKVAEIEAQWRADRHHELEANTDYQAGVEQINAAQKVVRENCTGNRLILPRSWKRTFQSRRSCRKRNQKASRCRLFSIVTTTSPRQAGSSEPTNNISTMTMMTKTTPTTTSKSTPKFCAVCGVLAFLGSWLPSGVIQYFCHEHAPGMSDTKRAEWTTLLGPGIS